MRRALKYMVALVTLIWGGIGKCFMYKKKHWSCSCCLLTFVISKKYRPLKDPCHLTSKYILSRLVLFIFGLLLLLFFHANIYLSYSCKYVNRFLWSHSWSSFCRAFGVHVCMSRCKILHHPASGCQHLPSFGHIYKLPLESLVSKKLWSQTDFSRLQLSFWNSRNILVWLMSVFN